MNLNKQIQNDFEDTNTNTFDQFMLASTGGLWGPVQHARQPLHKRNTAVTTFA